MLFYRRTLYYFTSILRIDSSQIGHRTRDVGNCAGRSVQQNPIWIAWQFPALHIRHEQITIVSKERHDFSHYKADLRDSKS